MDWYLDSLLPLRAPQLARDPKPSSSELYCIS